MKAEGHRADGLVREFRRRRNIILMLDDEYVAKAVISHRMAALIRKLNGSENHSSATKRYDKRQAEVRRLEINVTVSACWALPVASSSVVPAATSVAKE